MTDTPTPDDRTRLAERITFMEGQRDSYRASLERAQNADNFLQTYHSTWVSDMRRIIRNHEDIIDWMRGLAEETDDNARRLDPNFATEAA